jgi:ligand-binding sensor domain-containing protein
MKQCYTFSTVLLAFFKNAALRGISFFFVLLFIDHLSFSKEPFNPPKVDPLSELWRYTHFTDLDGKGIRSFAKDKDGNYWFGVNTGVIRYDGYSYKLYSEQDGLKGRDVDQLLVTTENRLYATTSSGVYYFEANSWHKLFPVKGDYNFTFKSLKQLSDGTLACGISEGLLLLDGKESTLVGSKSKSEFLLKQIPSIKYVELPLSCNYLDVSDILENKKGELWFALSLIEFGKIVIFNPEKLKQPVLTDFKVIDKDNGVYLGENQKILKARDGKIWVINNSYKVGINCFDGKMWEYIRLSPMFSGDEYNTSISQGADGRIWIGGLGKLFSYDHRKWKVYKSPEYSIPSSQVAVFPEKDGKLWLMGIQSKLQLIDVSENHWTSYLNLNYQCNDERGNQWFLSADGKVVVNEKGHWYSYDQQDGLMDAPVRLIHTSQNQIWVAGSNKGVSSTALFKNDYWSRTDHQGVSWGIDYRAVYEAKDGSIWFGSSVDHDPEKNHKSGVLQLMNPTGKNPRWVHHPSMHNGLEQSSFYGIAQSKDGKIWVGGAKLYNYSMRSLKMERSG